MAVEFEKIHGFSGPQEYKRFIDWLEQLESAGQIREVDVDPSYNAGRISGGRWFRNPDTNETWRVVAPDFPFKGLWEPIKVDP